MFDSYTSTRLVFATKRLIEDHGIIDPTIVEITCEAFNQSLPTAEPWKATDAMAIGQEIFASVRSHTPKVRAILTEEHGILTAPVNENYYRSDLREQSPRDAGQVRGSIAGPRARTEGIRVVQPDKDDPFYLAYLTVYGARAAQSVHNFARRTGKAVEIGAVDPEVADVMLSAWEERIDLPAPRAVIATATRERITTTR